MQIIDLLVDLVGIEPTTSSMPWKRAPSCATGPHEECFLYLFSFTSDISSNSSLFIFIGRKGQGSFISDSSNYYAVIHIENFYMSSVKSSSMWHFVGVCSIALPLSLSIAYCQTAAPPTASSNQSAPAAPKSSELLSPALSQISQAIVGLNISRWKAPGEVRSATQQNVDSIQRDLSGTLPGLLSTADAAPASVSAVFPVYRNIDALYDVLLRISETAELAAPPNEISSVSSALSKLESARTDLANAILNASKNTETEVVKLQASIQQAATAHPAPPPTTTVVNDGPPAKTTPAKRKKKPAAAPATTAPSSSSPSPQ